MVPDLEARRLDVWTIRDLARLRARNDALHERERRRKQGEPAWSGSAAAEPTGAPSPQPWIGQMQL